jgi:hypothetical protein
MRKFVLIGLMVAAPLLAEEPSPVGVLKVTLQLTDQQVAAVQQLAESRRSAVEPLAHRMGEQQQSLAAALSAEAPDAATVGTIMVSIRNTQRQVEQQQRAFAEGFLALLSEEQRARVEHIRSVEMALHAAQALHGLGL